MELIKSTVKCFLIYEYLYNYRYSANSLTTRYRENCLEIQFKLSNYIKEFLINNKIYNEENEKKLNRNICDIIISNIQNLFLKSSNLKTKEIKIILKKYLELKEVELLNNVDYEISRLKFMKKLILKKRINTIILYSKIKEFLRGVIKR